jgi:hypothetical protein
MPTDFNNFTDQELILLSLDGPLPADAQKVLADRMLANPSLRLQLDELTAVDHSLRDRAGTLDGGLESRIAPTLKAVTAQLNKAVLEQTGPAGARSSTRTTVRLQRWQIALAIAAVVMAGFAIFVSFADLTNVQDQIAKTIAPGGVNSDDPLAQTELADRSNYEVWSRLPSAFGGASYASDFEDPTELNNQLQAFNVLNAGFDPDSTSTTSN